MKRALVVTRDSGLTPIEELGFDQTGSGLEAEPLTDDEGDITAPFDPKKIDVITQQRTVDLLLTRLKEGELDLSPDFQRRANLWSEAQKSGLIESMLLRIPIPSLYVSEDPDGNYQVVDGLQRLCAIAHFVDVDALNRALKIKYDPLRLTKLQSLKDQDDVSFAELPRPLQRRLQETELTLHIIRAGTPLSVKFNIFSRINRGGLPLRPQEIRNAIYAGRWRDYVRKMATSEEFRLATEGRIKGDRLEDHELVLRFAALYAKSDFEQRPDKENLDDFLNNFVETVSSSWSDSQWKNLESAFYTALTDAKRIFGRIAFRKHSAEDEPRRPINRGLFETETVALARRSRDEIELLAQKSDSVVDLFGKTFNTDKDFSGALLYATGRGSSSNVRLKTIRRIFDTVIHAD
jgi:hypothetical protein